MDHLSLHCLYPILFLVNLFNPIYFCAKSISDARGPKSVKRNFVSSTHPGTGELDSRTSLSFCQYLFLNYQSMEIFMEQIPLTFLAASATDNHHPWYYFIFDREPKTLNGTRFCGVSYSVHYYSKTSII